MKFEAEIELPQSLWNYQVSSGFFLPPECCCYQVLMAVGGRVWKFLADRQANGLSPGEPFGVLFFIGGVLISCAGRRFVQRRRRKTWGDIGMGEPAGLSWFTRVLWCFTCSSASGPGFYRRRPGAVCGPGSASTATASCSSR